MPAGSLSCFDTRGFPAMKPTVLFLTLLLTCSLLVLGCSQQNDPLAPAAGGPADKNGTEALGPPDIAVAAGSGIVEAGTGLLSQPAVMELDVPGDVVQVLLYWSGGTNVAPYLGDDTIVIDGTEITGALIGGPSYFYDDMYFTAYRADVTGLGLVAPGANSLTVSGLDYEGGVHEETDGAGLLVIYDDGTTSTIGLRDGLDLAYFNFPGVRQTTVPQTFTFPAAATERIASMAILSGSVGADRPNEIRVTIDGGVQSFFNVLGSMDGPLWDSVLLDVAIPAGAASLTVELISTPGMDPRGASLSWTAGALSVPDVTEEPASLGDFVWEDLDNDGIQDDGEPGVGGVVVHLLDCAGNVLDETVTGMDGAYGFADLQPGDYNLHFVLPEGWEFSPRDAGGDDALDSDAHMNGGTDCTTLDPGEHDPTWDAGLHRLPMTGCTRTIGYWKNHAGFGPQDDMVTALLPIWLGDDDGDESLAVTDAATAVAVLEMRTYGRPNNGITKLYAQLLAAKLNVAAGADGSAVADVVDAADDFLAAHDWSAWSGLSRDDQHMVLDWMSMLDDYNNGYVGPGHCDDGDGDHAMDKIGNALGS